MLLGEPCAGAPLLSPAHKHIVTVTTADGLVMLLWHVELCSALIADGIAAQGQLCSLMHHESVL